jgi:hypothetical protein
MPGNSTGKGAEEGQCISTDPTARRVVVCGIRQNFARPEMPADNARSEK